MEIDLRLVKELQQGIKHREREFPIKLIEFEKSCPILNYLHEDIIISSKGDNIPALVFCSNELIL